jgi:GDP-L-fucose synthase
MVNLKKANILLTGGHGFLGQHVYNELLKKGVPKDHVLRPRSSEMDLRIYENCAKAVQGKDIVIHLAANFDGVKYNLEHAGEVFYDNAVMGLHLTESSRKANVKKIVIAGTVSSYPETASIPFREDEFWDGLPEKGNSSYGLAKRMLAAQIVAYQLQYKFTGVHLLLTNMYGPGDEFDLAHSNVVASLIRKFIEAERDGVKEIVMWGSGKATREFLYVEDAARAVVLAAQKYESPDPVNIGSGKEDKIKTLAETVAKLTGYSGKLVWDKTKPEGALRRVSDVSRAKKDFGFSAKTSLEAGLKKTVQWYSKILKNSIKKPFKY